MTRQHLEPTVEQATKIWMEGKDDSGVVETYRRSSYHKVAFIVSCAMLMVVSIVVAIGLGPVKIGFIESIQTLISHMVGAFYGAHVTAALLYGTFEYDDAVEQLEYFLKNFTPSKIQSSEGYLYSSEQIFS